jgi:hydroxymethylpyrimidine/phosphomethylpyrimidine kinase
VLLKGGHLRGAQVVDLLLQQGRAMVRISGARIESRNTHGTGCTLSSAIACFLALGHDLPEAVRQAHSYIYQAIAQGADVETGRGHGPLNHAYAPRPMQKLPN